MFIIYTSVVLMALCILSMLMKVVLDIVQDMRMEESTNKISHTKATFVILLSILIYIGVMIAIMVSIYQLMFIE